MAHITMKLQALILIFNLKIDFMMSSHAFGLRFSEFTGIMLHRLFVNGPRNEDVIAFDVYDPCSKYFI